jgi:predicted  nucleic acid-binding Zn-ribbon protein
VVGQGGEVSDMRKLSYEDLNRLAAQRRDRLVEYQKKLDAANRQRGEAQKIIGKLTMDIAKLERLLNEAEAKWMEALEKR